jgi:hypothetical protein
LTSKLPLIRPDFGVISHSPETCALRHIDASKNYRIVDIIIYLEFMGPPWFFFPLNPINRYLFHGQGSLAMSFLGWANRPYRIWVEAWSHLFKRDVVPRCSPVEVVLNYCRQTKDYWGLWLWYRSTIVW